MIKINQYMPILKWKMGEYQALERLDKGSKDSIVPLFEIPPIDYDHAKQQDAKSLDAHLNDFGKKLKSKWDGRACFVDMQFVTNGKPCILSTGHHCVDSIFLDARANGCQAIPVITLNADAAFRQAVARVIQQDRRGVALRITVSDFDNANMPQAIDLLLAELSLKYIDVDLILDMKAPDYQSLSFAAMQMQMLLGKLPTLNLWRSLVVAASSFPSAATALAKGYSFIAIPRNEWKAYKLLIPMLGTTMRLPSFGDYAVASPEMVSLDMRMIQPSAKVRYTYDDNWHFAVGKSVRSAGGFGQYRHLCDTLTKQPYFDGAGASEADDYIAKCAAGTASTGNLSTWVWVATNRHLTLVPTELASFVFL